MPQFKVSYRIEEDAELLELVRELALDEQTFTRQLLDLGEELYQQHDERLPRILTLTALEPIPERAVDVGMVVWRDWAELDLTATEGRLVAIAIIHAFKPVWRDLGPDADAVSQMLIPEPWEVKHYDLHASDGYII